MLQHLDVNISGYVMYIGVFMSYTLSKVLKTKILKPTELKKRYNDHKVNNLFDHKSETCYNV